MQNIFMSRLEWLWIEFQKIVGIRRRQLGEVSISDLRRSLIWGALCTAACKRVLEYVNAHPRFMMALRFCHIPEEVFFATALYDSDYRVIEEDCCLRYMDWHSGRGDPAILDESDYTKIISKKDRVAFVRKCDSVKTARLISLLMGNDV